MGQFLGRPLDFAGELLPESRAERNRADCAGELRPCERFSLPCPPPVGSLVGRSDPSPSSRRTGAAFFAAAQMSTNCFRTSARRLAAAALPSSMSLPNRRSPRSSTAPFLICSAMSTTMYCTRADRLIAFCMRSLPCSIRRAKMTSPWRVSSGTAPISRRYTRTGSSV